MKRSMLLRLTCAVATAVALVACSAGEKAAFDIVGTWTATKADVTNVVSYLTDGSFQGRLSKNNNEGQDFGATKADGKSRVNGLRYYIHKIRFGAFESGMAMRTRFLKECRSFQNSDING